MLSSTNERRTGVQPCTTLGNREYKMGWQSYFGTLIIICNIVVHHTRGGRELFLLGSRAWHVRLISYRRADCVDEMIEFTVRYHSNPCAHILTVSLSLTSRSQSTAILQFYHGRMTTWFFWETGRATIYGNEDVSEIEQDISLANVLVILPV